ncbi:unnamed protein product [Thelazia callipaeda]|uniref:G2/mitotic-specific cyclin-B3 n=1 Tax=Thelazia callipaeda TaxID=103827 RepID=A0A0N5CSP7_THECL|nr:unnamed protein product [Thelazia callipaeda]
MIAVHAYALDVENYADFSIRDFFRERKKRTGLTDLSNAVANGLHIRPEIEENCRGGLTSKPRETIPPVESDRSPSPPQMERSECPLIDTFIWAHQMQSDDTTSVLDLYYVPEYASDIFEYFRFREQRFRSTDYLPNHPKMLKVRRAKVVDWFSRCQETFKVSRDVFYHSVKLFDIYLSLSNNIQQIDFLAAAVFILATKVDQQFAPQAREFCNLSATSRAQTLQKYEREILITLNCDINFPLSYRFLRRFAILASLDGSTVTMARYVLETSLLFYEFIGVRESVMAAASLLLALKIKEADNWPPRLEYYTGYTVQEMEPLMWRLNHMLVMCPIVFPQCRSIFERYARPSYLHVANTDPLPDRYSYNEPVGPPPNLGFRREE